MTRSLLRVCTLAVTSGIWLAAHAHGFQVTALGTLRPSGFVMRNPGQQQPGPVIRGFRVSSVLTGDAVVVPTETSVSYAIPSGQQTFTGIIAYSAADPSVTHSKHGPNRVRVRILVDDSEVFSSGLDDGTPPVKFAVPLGQGHALTIRTDDEFADDRVYLVNSEFHPEARPPSRSYLLPPGTGYVNLTPDSRELFFHIFRPGEAVAASANYGGSANAANLFITVTPESGASAISSRVTVPLSPSGSALASGKFTWQAPSVRGPAMVEVREDIGGSTVFSTSFRIAIVPEVDLSRFSDPVFGVHISGAGYPVLGDEFASLWGAKWGRVFLRWDIVERQRGRYDFSRTDELMDIYSRQHMRILGVLGDLAPAWAGTPGTGLPAASFVVPLCSPSNCTALSAAFCKFVDAAVRRYSDKIEYWDVHNEVDVKYAGALSYAIKRGAETEVTDADVGWLRNALEATHRAARNAVTVCCSTGTPLWLAYDQRLFDKGLLRDIDAVSLHPYRESYPPELKYGRSNFREEVQVLENHVVRSNGGATKPIWATEANYVIGSVGQANVVAPDLDEHTRAEYDVRVNLLAYAMHTHYFLHAPSFVWQQQRLQLDLDTLSAYANMASLFSGAQWISSLLSFGKDDVYLVAAQSDKGIVGAIWTPLTQARVRLDGLKNAQFLDFYGNPISRNPSDVQVSGAPIYFLSSAVIPPSFTLLQKEQPPPWQPLPPLETWTRGHDAVYDTRGRTLHVVTRPMTFAWEFGPTAPISVAPNSCYLFRVDARVLRGGIFLVAVDSDSHQALNKLPLFAQGDSQPLEVELMFFTRNASHVQLGITGSNSRPDVSEFEVGDPQLRPCQ